MCLGYNPCECQICGRIFTTSAKRAKHEKSHAVGGAGGVEDKSPDGSPVGQHPYHC